MPKNAQRGGAARPVGGQDEVGSHPAAGIARLLEEGPDRVPDLSPHLVETIARALAKALVRDYTSG